MPSEKTTYRRIAVFPGSFDPITTGHVDIVRRALPLFDEIIVAIGINSQKQTLFDVRDRKKWIEQVFSDEPRIRVDTFEGLTVHFCKKAGAGFLIRGLRNASDFDYEKTIAQLNKSMAPELETICIISDPEMSHISSTIVREILINGGDVSKFVPKEMKF